LQTKNDLYGYKTVSDAAMKIVAQESVGGLYRGLWAYSLTWLAQFTLQMTAYELLIDSQVVRLGPARFRHNQQFYII
jgi:hypothetical protein